MDPTIRTPLASASLPPARSIARAPPHNPPGWPPASGFLSTRAGPLGPTGNQHPTAGPAPYRGHRSTHTWSRSLPVTPSPQEIAPTPTIRPIEIGALRGSMDARFGRYRSFGQFQPGLVWTSDVITRRQFPHVTLDLSAVVGNLDLSVSRSGALEWQAGNAIPALMYRRRSRKWIFINLPLHFRQVAGVGDDDGGHSAPHLTGHGFPLSLAAALLASSRFG